MLRSLFTSRRIIFGPAQVRFFSAEYFAQLHELNKKRHRSDDAEDRYLDHVATFQSQVLDNQPHASQADYLEASLQQFGDHILSQNKSGVRPINELLVSLNHYFD